MILFSPAPIWNARHGWVSFLFQVVAPAAIFSAPFVSLTGGAAVFFLPWIWLRSEHAGLSRCAAVDRPHIVGCWLLAVPAHPVLYRDLAVEPYPFHWTAPGYLMLAPLLGEAIARRLPQLRIRRAVITTGSLSSSLRVFSPARCDLIGLAELCLFPVGADPTMAAVDWTSLRGELARRGLLGRPGSASRATCWLMRRREDRLRARRSRARLVLWPGPASIRDCSTRGCYAGSDVLIIAPRRRWPYRRPRWQTLREGRTSAADSGAA